MFFLVAESISKSYRGLRVLSSATLRAARGQITALLGRNGVGKSTLMKVAAGIVSPETGSVRIEGQIVERPTLASMARAGVFYLPDHDWLSWSLTLGKQLELFADVFCQREATEAARMANVEHLLARSPRTFSGGELRRAELAAVLTRRPACLLADEPYRSLAPVDQEKLTRLLRELASDECAVVVSGHEVPSLLDAAHRVTWCVAGTTYDLGPPAHAVRHEAFAREYLGSRVRVC
jgi:ABC-type multidrug transport system ATPase subunit